MNAAALGRTDRLGAAVDVLEGGAREATDHRVLGAPGDLLHRGEVTVGGDGKAGLDNVDAHLIEQFGDLELLLMGHGRAGALLAVAQGGVEDVDAVLFGLRWHAHGFGSFSPAPVSWRSRVPSLRGTPECPGAKAQPALRGR